MAAPSLYKLPPAEAASVLALAVASLKSKAASEAAKPGWVPYPHQVPPAGDWDLWILMAGRGAGKTDAGAHYVDAHAKGPACIEGPTPHRIAIVAPSYEDAVDTCVRGESGLLQANRRIKFTPGAQKSADLTWSNGAEAQLFGTFAPEDVERFRGPQHCLVWADELAAWRKLNDVWDMIAFGLRLGPKPRVVATTTPKRKPKLKELLARAGTVVSHAKTSDNPALPIERREELYRTYGGTTLGRQELDAELIEDVEGALWKRSLFRIEAPPLEAAGGVLVPQMSRLIIAVDPAVTSDPTSDEWGVIGMGLAKKVDQLGRSVGWVLEDRSVQGVLAGARAAVKLFHELKADQIVAESNQGGEMVRLTIQTVDANVPVKLVHASQGKRTRAEPVVALYEQGRIRHAKSFPELEDQQCSWDPVTDSDSPDRLDAVVWGATELMLGSQWGGGKAWGG